MSKWISVKDKFPEVNQEVLVFNNAPIPIHCAIYKLFISGSFEFVEYNSKSAYYKGITHWMPLPEFPKTK